MEHIFGKPPPRHASEIPEYADKINSRVNSHDRCVKTCEPKNRVKCPRCRLCIFRPPQVISGIYQVCENEQGETVEKDTIDPAPANPPASYPLELPDPRCLVFEQKRWHSTSDKLRRCLETEEESMDREQQRGVHIPVSHICI